MIEPGFSPKELVARWGLSYATLKQWRAEGNGPPWIKRGPLGIPRGMATIHYPLPGVLAFEEANNIIPLKP